MISKELSGIFILDYLNCALMQWFPKSLTCLIILLNQMVLNTRYSCVFQRSVMNLDRDTVREDSVLTSQR